MDITALKEAWSKIVYYVENVRGQTRVYRTLAFNPSILLLISPHNPKIRSTYYKKTLEPQITRIGKKTADYILGGQFRNYTENWTWCGQKYRVSENYNMDLYREAPKHYGNYRIGWYRGKLYWFILYVNSLPQQSCTKFPFYGLDKEPGVGEGSWSWAQLHNLKPVYCMATKRYI